MFFLPLARKPEKVDHIDAAGCIGDVVKAYTALHYQARVCSGETVLILNGASVITILFLFKHENYEFIFKTAIEWLKE